jgi:hypothetical protein
MRRFFQILCDTLYRLRRSLARWVAAWLARRLDAGSQCRPIDCGGDVVDLPCSIMGGPRVADDATFHDLRGPGRGCPPSMTFEKF